MANKRRRRSQAGSSITEADLLQIEKTEKRRADRPKGLSLGRIHLAENVFQWRNRNENIVQSDSHLTELARILRSTGKPLDPIVVTAVGKKFYLVEGHHRILAYRKVRWDGPVPEYQRQTKDDPSGKIRRRIPAREKRNPNIRGHKGGHNGFVANN
jgi:hypothetical protein